MKTLFVRNVPPATRESDIHELFSQFGTVRGVKLPRDLFSGACRGFAMVDMEGHEARAAMAGLNESTLNGHTIQVREERPRNTRGGRGRRR